MYIITGRPEQDDRTEQALRKTLKEIDSLLDIRWFAYAGINPKNFETEGRYAIVSRWADADERWSMYQSGEIGEPFDLLGYLQVDQFGDFDPHSGSGTPVPLDQMTDLIINFLGSFDNTRQSWRDRMKATIVHNKGLRDDIKSAIVDETMDEVEYQRKRMAGEPIVCLGAALPDIPKEGAHDD